MIDAICGTRPSGSGGTTGSRPDEGPDNEGGALAEVALDEGGDLALERQAIAF
jgi:hypothetical protein